MNDCQDGQAVSSGADDVLAKAKAFGQAYIEPNAELWERDGSVPREYFEAAAQADLCRLLVPAEYGGLGMSMSDFVAVLNTLAGHCLASTFALVVHNNLAAAIARHGDRAQRERYLQPMMDGKLVGAFLLTEPGVGSDASAIKTLATKTPQGWLLNGAKAWISNARHADVLSVYAQTDMNLGARGIAGFLIDANTRGVRRSPGYDLLGGHALGTGGFEFAACEIESESVFFPPGEAFRAAMQGIDIARIGVAAMCCGMVQRSLDEAIGYTNSRELFGARIGNFQGVQWMLADCATDLEAARALTLRAANLIDEGADATVAAAHAKKFASRIAFSRIAECMQVMGAAGLGKNYPLARHLAGAKIAQYLDGATEIQNVVIARALMKTGSHV